MSEFEDELSDFLLLKGKHIPTKVEMDRFVNLLDHLELINWIQYSSYRAANIGATTINFDGREFIQLPSGAKVKITIKIERCTS